jgi:RNA-directed DNA polymerase
MRESHLTLSTPEDLATLLGLPSTELLQIALRANRSYRKRTRIKPNGGIRVFRIPNKHLKKIQQLIQQRFLRHLPVHDSIYSYRKKRDIVKGASLHVGHPVLVKLDIKEFFPNIRPRSVYVMFCKMGCSDAVAMLLTQLTTYENQLPQGPPTSPDIANQILTPMVRRIDGVCREHGLTLSAVGDDIFVSGRGRAASVNNLLLHIVENEGYPLNHEKSGVSKAGERKIITGISVSTKINIPKDYYKKVRAILHRATTCGFHNLFPGLSGRRAQYRLRGMIAHIRRLNQNKGDRLREKFLMLPGLAIEVCG